MNYDNLHTTAEILEAFQGCRDAGEEIDLFEALAWRDEPPVEAFVAIVREIKLEPVLALAIQSLLWVRSTGIKERLKKSDDLLSLLSNLAKSGETDLIRWSAAYVIEQIGFDFISVSRYLTESPKRIADSIVNKRSQTQSIYNDSVDFWVYGRTDFLWLSNFCCKSDVNSVEKAKEIYELKGIRGINEINFLVIESFKENTPDIFNLTLACQGISGKMILSFVPNSLSQRELEILVLNQILCVSSHHAMARKSAVEFLRNNESQATFAGRISLSMEKTVRNINAITNTVNAIGTREVKIDRGYIDQDDIAPVKKTVLEDFESRIKIVEANRLEESNKSKHEIDQKQKEKEAVALKIQNISANISDRNQAMFLLILTSPVILPVMFLVLWLPSGAFFGGFLAITQFKGDYVAHINGFSMVASIIFFLFYLYTEYLSKTSLMEKKLENEREKESIEFKKLQIDKHMQQVRHQSTTEIEMATALRNTRMAGAGKIEGLLNERKNVYKVISEV